MSFHSICYSPVRVDSFSWAQFEFVRQLSSQPQNTVFALVRTKANSQKLLELDAKNVHVLEADITDVKALKVTDIQYVLFGTGDSFLNFRRRQRKCRRSRVARWTTCTTTQRGCKTPDRKTTLMDSEQPG